MKYPKSAIRNKIEGEVILRFAVETDGSTSNHEIIITPSNDLATAALKAVKSVEWLPAVNRGRIIKTYLTIPVSFNLPKQ